MQNPNQPFYTQPAFYPPEVERAANTALALEIIFGLLGILGAGHAFAGQTKLAIKLFAGYLVYSLVVFLLISFTLGCIVCLILPINITILVISGMNARTYVKQTGATGQWSSVAKFVGGAFLLIFVIACIIAMIISFSGSPNIYR